MKQHCMEKYEKDLSMDEILDGIQNDGNNLNVPNPRKFALKVIVNED